MTKEEKVKQIKSNITELVSTESKKYKFGRDKKVDWESFASVFRESGIRMLKRCGFDFDEKDFDIQVNATPTNDPDVVNTCITISGRKDLLDFIKQIAGDNGIDLKKEEENNNSLKESLVHSE